MVQLAKQTHRQHTFICDDIGEITLTRSFELILAWDSLFHLPLAKQKPVLAKLCEALSPGGLLLYTYGNDIGEHTDSWRDDTFYYSSLGITENLKILRQHGLTPLQLELDQYPEKHVVTLAQRQPIETGSGNC